MFLSKKNINNSYYAVIFGLIVILLLYLLQDHVSQLKEEKTLQNQYETLKQENHNLTNKVNELEEKLQDLNERNEEMKIASQHKIQDVHREHNLELQVS